MQEWEWSLIHSITGKWIVCRFPVFFLRTGKESAILYAMSRKKAVVRKPKIKKKTDYYDYSLLAVIILLTCFGLVMLYSTSSYMAELNHGDDMYYFKKQAAISLACIIAALAISKIDYHILTRFTGVIYGVAAVLMLLVKTPLGRSANGARRWLNLGPLSFQPSELAKIAVIVCLSYMIKYGKKDWYTESLYDAGRKWRCACIHNICIYR